jgi:hypothetical protein
MRKEMKKLFVIALLWATISIFSAGCVDVGNPTGNPNDPNQNNPDGNGGNDGNNNNDGNGGNDGNSTLDPDDPMYPGESGTYTTIWTLYGTKTTSQKYIGATYDDSNTATVVDRQQENYKSPAPYKTTFSDGSVCYSIGPFVYVSYSFESQTDSSYQGNAIDGFVVVDYKYDENTNQVVYREDPTTIESTGNTSGKYTTVINYIDPRVTSQPILQVPYQKSSSGEIYYGTYLTNSSNDYPYVIKWSDGSYTLSRYPFSGIDFRINYYTADFSYDSAGYNWQVGTAPTGRKESDYTFNPTTNEYQYNAGGNTSGAATAETGDPIEDILEDAEDILGDILDNDGLRIKR